MSSSPAMTRTGKPWIVASRSVVSCVWITLSCARYASTDIGSPAISDSNSFSSSSRSSKNGTVNAQRVTSRMMNGAPFTGAMSCHIENIREQNGPGAAYVLENVALFRSDPWLIAYSCAIIPPIDVPRRWKPEMPSESTSALVSSAIIRLV